jgi:DNA-damage-inducible protein D
MKENTLITPDSTKIALFQQKEVRRTIYKNEWWFVIEDIIVVLTDSINPRLYIKQMRRRDVILSEGWVQIVSPLAIETPGGRQKMNCANTEGIFRIIKSIPSPKAEP